MKTLIFYIAHILGLTVLTLTLFWATHKYIVFNQFFLEYNSLKILYYTLTTILSFGLCLIWIFSYKKVGYFVSNLIIALIATYLFVSIFSSYGEYCDEEKNMNISALALQFILFLANIFLILKYIVPRLTKKTILLVSVSTGLVIVDFLFFWVSFSIYSNSFLNK